MQTARKALFPLCVVLVFGRAWLEPPPPPQARFALAREAPERDSSNAVIYETRFASHGTTESVHSAAVVEVSYGNLRAFWYGGSREGAEDVAIYTSTFAPALGRWSQESLLVSRGETERRLVRHVRKLGNPVAVMGEDDRLWLFYVSVSVGGWSGSAVNCMLSMDEGRTWSGPRRLITSPFLNLSTLVKGPPLLLEDGGIALPAYHELLGRFGELVRLDRDGNVTGKSRLSWGASSIQPVVVPSSPTDALALLRHTGSPPARVWLSKTTDGGRHWTHPERTTLPNPDSAIACSRVDDGSLLLVFNNSETKRNVLSLAYSNDAGARWRVLHDFEKDVSQPTSTRQEFSYPCLIQTRNGDWHLLYTWNRSGIKHVRFNRAWLEQRIR